jgi:hypothetical protein
LRHSLNFYRKRAVRHLVFGSIPVLLCFSVAQIQAQSISPPYPSSQVISGIKFDWSTHIRRALGSDNFPITWADDDNQYTAWGDGWGFCESGLFKRLSCGRKKSLGVSRVSGSPDSYVARDLWTSNGKSYGIVSVNRVLYIWVSPGSNEEAFQETRLYRSTDRGQSWSKANWAFDYSSGIFTPTFLQFGKDYEGSRDNFVYIFAPERKSTAWEVQKPGEISLWRVPKGHVMERARYEFFAGLNQSGAPLWTPSFAQRQTVLADAGNGIMRTSVSYNPGIQRYLLITEHTARAKGNIGIYDAVEPWGPWTTVFFEHGWGSPNIEANTFFWNLSNKWLSQDGKDFVLLFTGKNSNDSWNTVRGTFVLRRKIPVIDR